MVFVVDDDRSMRTAISSLLEQAGYVVRVFSSGLDVIQALAEENPVCMIVDVKMPRMTGLELQVRLKRIGYDNPIIFLTGQSGPFYKETAMRHGAAAYLLKPSGMELLVEAVAKCHPQQKSD